MGANEWVEWRELVLSTLREHGEAHKAIQRDIGELRTEVAKLKTQASMFGGIAGLLAGFFHRWGGQ